MKPDSVVERFRASMSLDHDAWHDGTGYDISLFGEASPEDKEEIARLVSPPTGWRDVQTLAALNTELAITFLRDAIDSEHAEVRTAVTRYAPFVASDEEKAELLVRALTTGAFYQDMTSALQQIESFHPKPVVEALFRGLFSQSGEVACHFAAMLTFVHKKAKTKFDWNHRPLFLKFNTEDLAERRAAFSELCELLKIDEGATLRRMGQP